MKLINYLSTAFLLSIVLISQGQTITSGRLYDSQVLSHNKDSNNLNITWNSDHPNPDQSIAYTKTAYCSNSSSGNIPLLSCSEIGTAAFNNSQISVNLSSSQYVWNNAPSPAASCQGAWAGNWSHYSLDPNVDALNITFESAGLSYYYNGIGPDIFIAIFQGSDCSNLTEVDCQQVAGMDAFGFIYLDDIQFQNLNPNQDIWLYTSSDDDYILNNVTLQGMSTPSNSSCATAGQTNDGCNSGVQGDETWNGPSANNVMCFGTNCTHSITMYDVYDDGWDGGGELRLYINGNLSAIYTIGSNASGTTVDFTTNPEDLVEIVWHSGTFENENAFVLDHANGWQDVWNYGDLDIGSQNQNFLIYSDYAYCTSTWYSNENTVFYTFTATAANASLEIENAICNDGSSGEMQVGVWETCADIGNYNSGFIGCSVGAGTLTMPTLTIDQTYVIAVDGQAGDICTWDFIANGIILPVELINLKAERQRGQNLVYWSTASEYNSDHFIIERSLDGYTFEEIGKIDAAGTTNELTNYEFKDFDQKNHTVYYRLKQFDKDGNFEYHGPRPVYFSGDKNFSIAPNPTGNKSWLTFEFDSNSIYEVYVLDLSGRKIITKELNTTAIGLKGIELATDTFEAGVYLVYLIENGALIGTKELIKK